MKQKNRFYMSPKFHGFSGWYAEGAAPKGWRDMTNATEAELYALQSARTHYTDRHGVAREFNAAPRVVIYTRGAA